MLFSLPQHEEVNKNITVIKFIHVDVKTCVRVTKDETSIHLQLSAGTSLIS